MNMHLKELKKSFNLLDVDKHSSLEKMVLGVLLAPSLDFDFPCSLGHETNTKKDQDFIENLDQAFKERP